jgi:hypothetical protein
VGRATRVDPVQLPDHSRDPRLRGALGEQAVSGDGVPDDPPAEDVRDANGRPDGERVLGPGREQAGQHAPRDIVQDAILVHAGGDPGQDAVAVPLVRGEVVHAADIGLPAQASGVRHELRGVLEAQQGGPHPV